MHTSTTHHQSLKHVIWLLLACTCATAPAQPKQTAAPAVAAVPDHHGLHALNHFGPSEKWREPSLDVLLQLNRDNSLPHEAPPLGVPSSFDWYKRPRPGRWNSPPPGFEALTGWGQAFWAADAKAEDATLEIREINTYLCSGVDRRWTRVQGGTPEGAAFDADFQHNRAVAAEGRASSERRSRTVRVPLGKAFHFWPQGLRAQIPNQPLCGMLVLVQARAVPAADGAYEDAKLLLGLGADYWLSRTAPWDYFKTNSDVAIGRLHRVPTTWQWFGLSTASNPALVTLITEGFSIN